MGLLYKRIAFILIIAFFSVERMAAQVLEGPDTVYVQSGDLTLKGLLWRPTGKGPFAAIIFCHGSYTSDDTIHDPIKEASVPGPVFARKEYIYLALFRRGVGLSKGQGLNSADLMESAFKKNGLAGRNKVQLEQLETAQMQDMLAGISYLRKRPDVDISRITIVGHSFGGSLALLVAEHEPGLSAVVVFSPAGYSWNLSPQLRDKLISASRNISAPIMIIHAQNDYTINPGYSLDSVLNQLQKPHLLEVYPSFGNSANEGHNLIFLNTEIWERDVFKFLAENPAH